MTKMTRILMLKNRKNELRAMSKILVYGSLPKGFIPLVEIVKEEKAYEKKVDHETGKYVTNPVKTTSGKIRHYKVNDPETERDVTLSNLDRLFGKQLAFVEYFRGDLDNYKDYDPEKNRLVVELNLNLSKYQQKTLEISQHENLVPVIAIKEGIDNVPLDQLTSLINKIRATVPGKAVAIRIDVIDGYEEALEELLTPHDYLLFDISEQPIDSKEMEYEELGQLNISAQKILLCSPRKRDTEIKDFIHRDYTVLIDNSGIDKFRGYGFTGYGDYGGLGDKLLARSFTNTSHPGRALALLYNGDKRAFKSYVCDDVTLGQTGYRQLLDLILQDRDELDLNRDCIVYQELEDKIRRGVNCTYQDWIQYTLMRYVQQLSAE